MESKFRDNPLPKCNGSLEFGGKISLYDIIIFDYRIWGGLKYDSDPSRFWRMLLLWNMTVATEHKCFKKHPQVFAVFYICVITSAFFSLMGKISYFYSPSEILKQELHFVFREYLWKALHESNRCVDDLVISYATVTSFFDPNIKKISLNKYLVTCETEYC